MIGRAENYYIKDGYRVRLNNYAFDDTPFADEYQRPVYEYARALADRNGYRGVTDLGCGSGFKLVKFFNNFKTVGIDLPDTVKWLKTRYPDRCWREFDPQSFPSSDLLICSDVIEHIVDPNTLLDYIERLNPKSIVLSTPERDLLKLGTEDGPPKNAHHVREWNQREFRAYCESRFTVVNHFVAEAACQIIECEPRR